MKLRHLNNLCALLAVGVALAATTNSFAQDDSVGYVRISQQSSSQVSGQQVAPVSFHHRASQNNSCDCQNGQPCPENGAANSDWCDQCRKSRGNGDCRCRHADDVPFYYMTGEHKQAMKDYLRCKMGYFIPTGGGGSGIPWVGKYARVYPQDPHYFDQRDGQVWAAQGYGAPIAVPLAPVVGHTYNYGWGIPSSRLTPISTPAY